MTIADKCHPNFQTSSKGHTPCRRKLFGSPSHKSTPVAIEKEDRRRQQRIRRNRTFKTRKRRTCRRMKISNFMKDYGKVLGKPLTEICLMKIQKRRQRKARFSPYQKWLASNLMLGCGGRGYDMLRDIGGLPSHSTLIRSLRNFKTKPGISDKSTELMVIKNN